MNFIVLCANLHFIFVRTLRMFELRQSENYFYSHKAQGNGIQNAVPLHILKTGAENFNCWWGAIIPGTNRRGRCVIFVHRMYFVVPKVNLHLSSLTQKWRRVSARMECLNTHHCELQSTTTTHWINIIKPYIAASDDFAVFLMWIIEVAKQKLAAASRKNISKVVCGLFTWVNHLAPGEKGVKLFGRVKTGN